MPQNNVTILDTSHHINLPVVNSYGIACPGPPLLVLESSTRIYRVVPRYGITLMHRPFGDYRPIGATICHPRLSHAIKTYWKKYPSMWCLHYTVNWQKIFTVIILKIPQNDRLDAPGATKTRRPSKMPSHTARHCVYISLILVHSEVKIISLQT